MAITATGTGLSKGGGTGATTSNNVNSGAPASNGTGPTNGTNGNSSNNNNSGNSSNQNGAYYGRDKFDPVLILAQIILLQACFYTSYLILLVIFHRATGTSAPLTDQMLDHDRLTLSHFPGWVSCTALILAACGPTALCFVAVVGRARRALDFAATLLVSHIIATSVHSGFPTHIFWWVVNIGAAAGLAAVAETVSLRVELREISIHRSDRDRERDSSTKPSRLHRDRDFDRDRLDDIEAQHLHDRSQGATDLDR